jgi:malonyl-CoA O-methyltransferase
MADSFLVDKNHARRSFARAARGYDQSAVLQNEVSQRMLDRLDYIKVAPQRILDAGSGTGGAISGLLHRYKSARVIALDVALPMLQLGRKRQPWWRQLASGATRSTPVCGDMERLPLASSSVDLVWSNLALQWLNDAPACFAELRRVLAPGGLVLFSTFGPDTLKELRNAYASVDGYTHVNRFTDMHDIGDMLVAAGFADPVMDMEQFTLTYPDVRALMLDLKAIGAHNVTLGRPPGLTGRSRFEKLTQNYETFRHQGTLPATFEVIYGHAWKPLPRRSPSGHPVIDITAAPGS